MAGEPAPHFICSIGTGNYGEVTYELGGQVCKTRFAPVALARLTGLRGKASVVVTRAAREKWYAALASELREAGLEPQAVEVPEGRTREECLEIFHRLVEAVSEGEHVVLDATFALRHLPFVYLAALTYLTAYRSVTIDGIYYGAYELPDPQTEHRPVLDLTVLFDLTEWYHSVQTAAEGGDLRPLARHLRQDVARLFQDQQGDRALSRAKDAMEELAPVLAAGLPLETGRAARLLLDALRALEGANARHHVAYLSLSALTSRLEHWAFPVAVRSKRGVALTTAELLRQLTLIKWYVERRDVPKALLLLREWLLSLLVLRRGEPARWLDRDHREAQAHYLNGLVERAKKRLATNAEERLAGSWQRIAELRNQLAHAGMAIERQRRQQPWISIAPDAVANLVADARSLLENQTGWWSTPSGTSRLLVTPLGLSPGVVFTAVQRVQPDRLMVITSPTAHSRLSEALAEAGAGDVPVLVRKLKDPMTGFQEAKGLINAEVQRTLVEAGEVVVNLTGGTTVIQYVAEQVAEAARRLGVPVRRVAVVDRRSVEEQRAAPYVLGELVELDGALAEQEDAEHGPTT